MKYGIIQISHYGSIHSFPVYDTESLVKDIPITVISFDSKRGYPNAQVEFELKYCVRSYINLPNIMLVGIDNVLGFNEMGVRVKLVRELLQEQLIFIYNPLELKKLGSRRLRI